jgi:CHAT domain-containing protein
LDDSISVIEGMRGRAGGGLTGRQRFLEDKLEPYDTLISFSLADGDIATAFEYSERSKANALLEVLASGSLLLQRMMEADERLREQQYQSELSEVSFKISQAQIDTKRNSELSELLDRRKQITTKYEEFVDRIYAKYFRINAKNGKIIPIKLSDSAELVSTADTAIVEFSVTDQATYVYVITKKNSGPGVEATTYPVQITRDALTSRVREFRGAIDRRSFGYQKLAVQLFDLLLGRASARLAGKNTIILVPDGPLWELPFQALESRAGRPWLEDHAMFEAPSLTALREMRHQREMVKPAPQPSLLAFINPRITSDVRAKIQARLDTRLTTLPNPTPQVEALRGLYGEPPGSLILEGQNATEEAFREDAGKYRTIYVFSHGVFNNENPLKSYVVVASTPGSNSDDKDGLLEADELMTLRLRADLVILAGCETARGHIGRGEGMIGMAWALFVAGTPTVIVSQWRVPAGSTRQLMLELHRALPKTGSANTTKTVAEALKDASLKTRTATRQKHPLYWAGFVVVGDGK